jgi:hypothetical protein
MSETDKVSEAMPAVGSMEIHAPFPGYYQTTLEAWIDEEEESFLEDKFGGDVPEDASDRIRYEVVFLDVAQEWVATLNQILEGAETEFRLKFKELWSPREYNTETNRIFCQADPAMTTWLLRRELKRDNLIYFQDVVSEECTDRPGFSSYYPADYLAWLVTPIQEWKPAQHSLVLQVALEGIVGAKSSTGLNDHVLRITKDRVGSLAKVFETAWDFDAKTQS